MLLNLDPIPRKIRAGIPLGDFDQSLACSHTTLLPDKVWTAQNVSHTHINDRSGSKDPNELEPMGVPIIGQKWVRRGGDQVLFES